MIMMRIQSHRFGDVGSWSSCGCPDVDGGGNGDVKILGAGDTPDGVNVLTVY